ncbi:MAG: phosphotransferase [Lysobacterales bacterium]|jgi:Ser/Thr protein kinase RdoA (MazF antagonist)
MTTDPLKALVLESLGAEYGLEGELDRLSGENLNYRLTTPDGRRYVLKIVDEHMPVETVQMEHEAIEHALRAGFELKLPQIIETESGNIETRIKKPINGADRLHLMEFVPGTPMDVLPDISEKLLFDVGRSLASFDRAMEDFDHPAAHRHHRWNLAEADRHRDGIGIVNDPEKQQLLSWAFDTWVAAMPTVRRLPHQFIHGDGHDENILAEGDRVTGLVDFGDCCHNPTICELAICLSYLMMREGDPVEIARTVIRGFHEVRPVSRDELDALYPLICGRLAVSLVVANKRKAIDPDNPNWFGGEERMWGFLSTCKRMGTARFRFGAAGGS